MILKADLYEVDDAFHQKVSKAKWRSVTELEELELKVRISRLHSTNNSWSWPGRK